MDDSCRSAGARESSGAKRSRLHGEDVPDFVEFEVAVPGPVVLKRSYEGEMGEPLMSAYRSNGKTGEVNGKEDMAKTLASCETAPSLGTIRQRARF